ncbi:hypothetical protein [Psychroflexus sp. ALD_RP9]|uniref:hypothetical protein n=1 Tax=Psychroflexus sp. ALD_RP9 TaxID=2777186 RepID=UPI001A8F22D2|nr:hypothetical protein [Psychroflexus sp. ALD_RP9]QSS96843.1 hypothetical protein IMZ30_10380 [Psychroflexus sp. ALD_RP9]
MENKKAVKLLNELIKDLEEANFITDSTVDKLKAIRPYAVEEKLPVIAKSLRLAYEHIEENEVFVIPIPQDEPLEDETEVDDTNELITGTESLVYLLKLIKNAHLAVNMEEIREYNRKFEAFAE